MTPSSENLIEKEGLLPCFSLLLSKPLQKRSDIIKYSARIPRNKWRGGNAASVVFSVLIEKNVRSENQTTLFPYDYRSCRFCVSKRTDSTIPPGREIRRRNICWKKPVNHPPRIDKRLKWGLVCP